MIRRYGRAIFARLLSIGVGCMWGSVGAFYMGNMDKGEAMQVWAIGTTFVAVGGLWFVLTGSKWDGPIPFNKEHP